MGELWGYVAVLRLQGIPGHASRLGIAANSRLQCKAVFLVGRYRTEVECAWRTAREVRVASVAYVDVVEARQVVARDNRLHRAVLVDVDEQQVAEVHVGARAGVRCCDCQFAWCFAQVMCLYDRIPEVHRVVELWIVWCQVVYHYRAGRAVVDDRILCVNDLDDLLVHIAVRVGIPERRVVRRYRIGRLDANYCWCPWVWCAEWRYDWAGQVGWRVLRSVRRRVWYVDARRVRIVCAPVDHFPCTLDFEACIRYYRVHFILERYAQQFAVFAEERWLAVYARRVAERHDHVVRETYVVVLLVVYNDAL